MQVQEILLTNIKPAESGERAKDVRSLAESIKAIGLIQPILVTPIRTNEAGPISGYQIIAGHRRYAATQFLKEKMIRCIVMEATDDKAQAMRISENVHRLPLTPLQEAEAIAKLRKLGRSTEEIAADLAMSAQSVARRERLLTLIPEWIKRWQKKDGRPMSVNTVELIAAQEPSTQKALLDQFKWGNPDLQQLKNHLSDYNQKLSSAPWPLNDSLLLPKAGACSECPKRSSCQPLLFDGEVDVNKGSKSIDRCLDVACWNGKRESWFRSKMERAREEHGDLLLVAGKNDWEQGRKTVSAVGKGKKILESHEFESAKKTDKNAKAAIIVSGANVGDVIFVTTGRKSSSSSGSPAKKSLSAVDDRKARRGKIILNKINSIISSRKVPQPLTDASHTIKLQMLEAILCHCCGDSKQWKGIGSFGAVSITDATKRLWDLVAGRIKLPDYSFAISLEYIDVVRPFAEKILGLNWADLEAEALKAVPDPKPKAGSSQKTTAPVKVGKSAKSKKGKK
ncbi:ParB/RepB/Spo0J family partition protein [Candidatus Pacearchaeota archaeon]|jgi:ParB/RepB/Spo0J family partition protein|nr:ParB/RepB/Spo0J family partition protein [Candidatus Pacearchaeota archaeon]